MVTGGGLLIYLVRRCVYLHTHRTTRSDSDFLSITKRRDKFVVVAPGLECSVVDEPRSGNRCQNTDDDNDQHQFNQGESTALRCRTGCFTHPKKTKTPGWTSLSALGIHCRLPSAYPIDYEQSVTVTTTDGASPTAAGSV